MASNVCIIGGGPAGIMLGFLLARAGVSVTVLEKHKDFFRDFRGDTIHPSTLEVLHELGLLDRFLALPHSRIDRLAVNVGGEQFTLPDFTHLPVRAPFIALMPQWDFLDFLVAEAKKFPAFTLRMECEATGLIEKTGSHGVVVSGVQARTADGDVEIPATLTVGCDGRHAMSRSAAHLPVKEEGVPIDVLWFRVARQTGDPENALGYINLGRALILINRDTYFQCAFIIAKGSFPGIHQRGLEAFRSELRELAPFLADRVEQIRSFDDVKLLTVQVNRLEQWARPGLLCIGDAAHAMSPVGGIGINIALQDAVAAANRLTTPLLAGTLNEHDLRGVQHYRQGAVRNTQRFQIAAHAVINRVLRNPAPLRPPVWLRVLTHVPGVHGLMGRFIGMGLQPEHVHIPEQGRLASVA